VGPDDAARLAPVVARCPRLRLAAGSRLTGAELASQAFLVVEAGVAAIAATRDGGRREMTVAIAGAGDILVPPSEGEELAALSELTLTAVTPLAYRVLLACPAGAAALVERLTEAVLDRQESIAQFAAVEHVERVRDKLLQLARAHGRVTSEGVHLDLPLTHRLIAQTTGSARETVTWAVAELSREGFLVREGRRYTLTVPPELLRGW